jgi:uncharacterized protein
VKWLLAGASGFLGNALRNQLATDGEEVVRLVRREPAALSEFGWDPDRGTVDERAFDGVDVVVNLCGAAVAPLPWTMSRRKLILSSRVNSGQTLARTLAARARNSSAPIFIQASGIARYGTVWSRAPHTEESPPAKDFLAQVVVSWEASADEAAAAGIRVVHLRTSPVLDRSGSPFQLMRLAWRGGLGATLGDGKQRMPMITLGDYLRVVRWAAETPDASGAYNVTIPEATTNAMFSDTLAEALGRQRLLGAPAVLIRTTMGELAEQLLGDMYVIPKRLLDAGFSFTAPDVGTTIRSALHVS